MKITIEMLKALETDELMLDWFRRIFPDGTTVRDLAITLKQNYYFNGWLRHLLYQKVEITRECLAAGADIHAEAGDLLICFSGGGNVDSVELLIEAGVDVEKYGWQALLSATRNNRFEIVKLLIEAGVNANISDEHILTEAAENGCYEIVEYLVEAGADIHAWNNCALRMAKREKHTKIIEYLENHIEKEKEIK